MRWRNLNYKTWKEIRKELPDTIRRITPGETYIWDLWQVFDEHNNYALVLGFDDEEELALMIAYEPEDSYMHEFYWDWLMPVVNNHGDVWDTLTNISVQDANRPEFLDNLIVWFEKEWDSMACYYTENTSIIHNKYVEH